jgi:hypothetical protein
MAEVSGGSVWEQSRLAETKAGFPQENFRQAVQKPKEAASLEQQLERAGLSLNTGGMKWKRF